MLESWPNGWAETAQTRIVNARFAATPAHYLFDPDFCKVASGWEKGRVEKSVQDSWRRIWRPAADQRFASFSELNGWLATQCIEAREALHPDFPKMSIQEAWEHQQVQLMPVPTPFDGYVESPARLSNTRLVSIARNRYSVPCALAGHRVRGGCIWTLYTCRSGAGGNTVGKSKAKLRDQRGK